jgi:hypothetical protein
MLKGISLSEIGYFNESILHFFSITELKDLPNYLERPSQFYEMNKGKDLSPAPQTEYKNNLPPQDPENTVNLIFALVTFLKR